MTAGTKADGALRGPGATTWAFALVACKGIPSMSNADIGLIIVLGPLCLALVVLMLIEFADQRSTRR
jgi:hypothetical protein